MTKGMSWLKPLSILAALALVACNNASFTANKQGERFVDNGAFTLPGGIPVSATTPQDCTFDLANISDCFKDTGVQGINVWVVVDTSSSFTVRESVGQQLSQNLRRDLNTTLPMTISVIAAHTRTSPFGASQGDVFYRASDDDRYNSNYVEVRPASSEPATILVNNQSDFASADMYLRAKLSRDMISDPRGSDYVGAPENNTHSGVNELGLLNILAAMDRVSTGDIARQQNYGWLVVFLSDENDVCVQDPDMVLKRGEQEMYETECFYGNSRITPSLVYNRMKAFAGNRPMSISAIVNQPGKQTFGDSNSGIGHGYLDLLRLSNNQFSLQ